MADADPHLAELFDWLRIPSVSADTRHRADVRDAGRWVERFVQLAGGSATVVETGSQPLVVGELPATIAGRRPTVLLYGHHDVQPVGNTDEWESPPFEPELRDGWIYARGASDDKGPFFALLVAARELALDGALPVGVRVVSDGEEEVLGHSVVDWLRADQQPVDAALIFDGVMAGPGRPAFVLGTRGLASIHVHLRTGVADLHSGFFGGAALNAAQVLVDLLAIARRRWLESTGSLKPAPYDESPGLEPGDAMLRRAGARPADCAAAGEFYPRTLALPSFEVTGISTGEAHLQQTAIPVKAEANLSLRLIPSQDPDQVAEALAAILEESAPAGADVDVTVRTLTPGVSLAHSPAIDVAAKAFEAVFGATPVMTRSGGTLPVVAALAERGIPTIMTGLDVHDGNAHGPNERLLVEHLKLGIEAAKATLVGLARGAQ